MPASGGATFGGDHVVCLAAAKWNQGPGRGKERGIVECYYGTLTLHLLLIPVTIDRRIECRTPLSCPRPSPLAAQTVFRPIAYSFTGPLPFNPVPCACVLGGAKRHHGHLVLFVLLWPDAAVALVLAARWPAARHALRVLRQRQQLRAVRVESGRRDGGRAGPGGRGGSG